MTNILDGMGGE